MIAQTQVGGEADFCDVLMSSASPVYYNCDCIIMSLRAKGEFQAELLALWSSGGFVINPDGFISTKLCILISSAQICQAELPLAGDPHPVVALRSTGLCYKAKGSWLWSWVLVSFPRQCPDSLDTGCSFFRSEVPRSPVCLKRPALRYMTVGLVPLLFGAFPPLQPQC